MISKKTINEFKKLDFENRLKKIYEFYDVEDILVSSSFAVTSSILLSMISKVNPKQIITFIDTGYHFKETIEFKKRMTKKYNLKVQVVKANYKDFMKTKNEKMWLNNPDNCCDINKVQPIKEKSKHHKIWISGLMGFQNQHRKKLDMFVKNDDIIKFYPFIDMTYEQRISIMEDLSLEVNPLFYKGYSSIGCTNCTKPSDSRNGRWNNNPKTECGLHL